MKKVIVGAAIGMAAGAAVAMARVVLLPLALLEVPALPVLGGIMGGLATKGGK